MKAVIAILLGLSTAIVANAHERGPHRGGGRGGGGYLPGGSYLQSCQSCGMSGSILYCVCPDGRGNWYNTSINVAYCRTPVANTYGRLTCD